MPKTMKPRRLALAALTAIALSLAACGAPAADPDPSSSDSPLEQAPPSSVEVVDNTGAHVIALPPQRVVATDNRLFQTLAAWGVKLAAAPVDLIPADNPYKTDTSVVNLGNHREPDLEAVVAVQPDLIINGQRFSQYAEDFQQLVPEAVLLTLDPRDGQPFGDELKRQIQVLGQVFGHETEAQALINAYDTAVARVKAAYDPAQTVMAVITSGGNVNYSAPGPGRTLGPVYDILGLTPALVEDGSTDHQGDDISVEAIAASNPDWILVMDRDAAISASSDGAYVPANELIANSEALQNVTAVQAGHIVYMPQYTYINEGIQTYTTFFEQLASALEKG